MGIVSNFKHWYAKAHPASYMKWRNAFYRLKGAGDGLPIPPRRLVYLVQGSDMVPEFIDSGKAEAKELIDIFTRHEHDFNRSRSFLDFGCGAGRVMRHLASWTGVELVGSDYNPDQVAWCRRHLTHASFDKNELAPPLNYPDERFHYILANSVFTHLSEPLQFAWMDELQRILAPGGLLLMTMMGQKMVDDGSDWSLGVQSPGDVERFYQGQVVVVNEERTATPGEYYYCTAWHPEQYVRETLSRGMEVVDFIPVAVFGYGLDAYVLRKPG